MLYPRRALGGANLQECLILVTWCRCVLERALSDCCSLAHLAACLCESVSSHVPPIPGSQSMSRPQHVLGLSITSPHCFCRVIKQDDCCMGSNAHRNAPSTAGNSMTSSERPSPEPLLEKEVSPAVLGGREFWKRSGAFKCLELQGLGDPSRTLERNSRKSSESVSGVFPEFFRNFDSDHKIAQIFSQNLLSNRLRSHT